MNFASRVEDWWALNGLDGYDVDVTGIMDEFGRAEEAIAYGQIRGLMMAFDAIGIVLLALFRSAPVTLIALLGNAFPIAAVYGAMGFANIPLDAATICVDCIGLGIGVDDTIHVVIGYRDRISVGSPRARAIQEVVRQLAFRVFLTTVAMCVGFVVLAASDFALVQRFGVVTAAGVVLFFVADMALLPVGLSWTKEATVRA